MTDKAVARVEDKTCKNCGCKAKDIFCSTTCYLEFQEKERTNPKIEKPARVVRDRATDYGMKFDMTLMVGDTVLEVADLSIMDPGRLERMKDKADRINNAFIKWREKHPEEDR